MGSAQSSGSAELTMHTGKKTGHGWQRKCECHGFSFGARVMNQFLATPNEPNNGRKKKKRNVVGTLNKTKVETRPEIIQSESLFGSHFLKRRKSQLAHAHITLQVPVSCSLGEQ